MQPPGSGPNHPATILSGPNHEPAGNLLRRLFLATVPIEDRGRVTRLVEPAEEEVAEEVVELAEREESEISSLTCWKEPPPIVTVKCGGRKVHGIGSSEICKYVHCSVVDRKERKNKKEDRKKQKDSEEERKKEERRGRKKEEERKRKEGRKKGIERKFFLKKIRMKEERRKRKEERGKKKKEERNRNEERKKGRKREEERNRKKGRGR